MSKKEYKINEPQPSNADLDKFKNFDKVVQNLPGASQSFWTKLLQPQGLATIASIAVVGSIAAYMLLKDGSETTTANTNNQSQAEQVLDADATTANPTPAANANLGSIASTAQVSPPIPKWDIPFEVFKINAEMGGKLVSQNGSLIDIGPNSFTNDKGQLVKGEIKILYREFHDPISIFLSGIPMGYDTLGEQHTFESAGMLEMYAEQNGKRVNLAPDKPVSVELVSLNNNKDDFNVYKFDDTKGAWDYVDECETKQFVDYKKQANTAPASTTAKTPEQPRYPQRNIDKYAFKASTDLSKFPELSSDLLFEINDSLSKFDPLWYEVQWDEISLAKSKHKSHYTLHLKRDATDIALEAYPVMAPANYKAAMAKYQSDLSNYENSKGNKVKFILSSYEPKETSATQKEIANLLRINSNGEGMYKTQVSLRPLVMVSLGIWNCDHPISFVKAVPQSNSVSSAFKDNKGQKLQAEKVYNVVGRKNALFTNGGNSTLNYSEKYRNLMWIVLDDESLALANPLEFSQIKGGQHEFTMTVYNSTDGLKKLSEEMGR